MNNDTTTQAVLFNDLFDKPLRARFDQPESSSDGGAVLLKACEKKLGLIEAMASSIADNRQADRVTHSLRELVEQRVYGMACGYEDCNDAARLSADPVHRLLLGRDPVDGERLASQPTLSRLENDLDERSLVRMGHALLDCVVARHRKRRGGRAHRITIDLDPTDDPTYGEQQLSLFNGHYGNKCYLPMAGFVQFDEESEQYLCAYLLRGGRAPDRQGALALLRRVIRRLRRAFPKAIVRVRLDGGFAAPEVFDFLERQRVEYTVAMAKNAVLARHAAPLMQTARQHSEASGKTEHAYGECRYAAGTWARKRRVIFKAEVVRHPEREPRDNPRFVVTNIRRVPRNVYEKIYCHRGVIEQRLKELLYGLNIDRTSCTRFLANQFRGLLAASAYVLLQELRLKAKRTGLCGAQVHTLRERLLKLAVWVERSTRRLVLHLPDSAPWRSEWCRIARALGAAPG